MFGWLAKFFGFDDAETTDQKRSGPSARDIAYHETRKIAHECGHAVLMWLSPAVRSVHEIVLRADGSGTAGYYPFSEHPDYMLERAVIGLGGLAGEILVWERVRGGGLDSDLTRARDCLKAYLEKSSAADLERRWDGLLANSGLDVAGMLRIRPPRELAAAMNLCYRRAKRKLMDNRAAFDRLIALATRKGSLTREDIASQFGPRIWVPPQWR